MNGYLSSYNENKQTQTITVRYCSPNKKYLFLKLQAEAFLKQNFPEINSRTAILVQKKSLHNTTVQQDKRP